MSEFKAYPEYKDSVFGVIPARWQTLALKRVLSTKITDGPHETPTLHDEGIPFISAEAVRNGRLDFNLKRGYITKEAHNTYKKKCLPQKNDIFMVKSGATTGNVAILEKEREFSIWSPLALIRANREMILPKFLFYFISSVLFKEQVETRWNYGTQQNIGMNILENLLIILPDLKDQKLITNFLNQKTIEINSLISDKERLIELLEEKRQAVITETVTKGLDPNVKMKDSGIEWIGEVPEHWNTTKIKYTTYVKGRIGWQGLRSDEFTDVGPHLVTGTDFQDGFINWSTCHRISEERYEEAPEIQLKNNDLLVTKDGTIGKVAIVKDKPEKAILNSGVFVTRPYKETYLTEYLYWILNSNVFIDYIDIMSSGTTVRHLYQETFNNFVYPIPNLKEQAIISELISRETSQLDNIINETRLQISKLKEYRESLIYEAVTGKIDVRNYVTEKEEAY